MATIQVVPTVVTKESWKGMIPVGMDQKTIIYQYLNESIGNIKKYGTNKEPKMYTLRNTRNQQEITTGHCIDRIVSQKQIVLKDWFQN
jgi:hypothetical protein